MNNIPRSILASVAALTVAGGFTNIADASSEAAEATEAEVVTFTDPETAVGRSTLRRNADGVYATFESTGVEPGHTVTLWWVVFNQPENCSDGACSEDDIFVDGDPAAGLNTDGHAAADIVASYAAGTIANDAGEVYLVARLDQDAAPVGAILGEGATLKDAAGAEIHLVARSHGPAIDGLQDVQLTSFEGGCEAMQLPGDVPDAEGECADIQFAVHQP